MTYYYTPVPIKEHARLLGKDFNNNFTQQMYAYYKPFLSKGRKIQLAKETWEYAVADSIPDAEWAGAGNNIVDVQTPTIQIDVKGLSCPTINSRTTEASILQNNKSKNDHFAKLFENKNMSGLKKMFIDPHTDKVNECKNLHIFCAVREMKTGKVYYCLFKAIKKSNKNLINQMKLDGKRSVLVPLINKKYGRTYLYIPKRRLELRLEMQGLSEYLVHSHTIS